MIYSHELPRWQEIWNRQTPRRLQNKYNGGYYYSREILENIIPLVKTDRNWITICTEPYGMNHCIVFVHDNLHPEYYEWLRVYKDLILVCNWPEICPQVRHLGKVIYLPVSIDVEYVKKFRTRRKTREVAYVGRSRKLNEIPDYNLPEGVDHLSNMPREELLTEMAKYKQVYAIDRVAQEAKVLGCEVLPYIDRFPDPERYQVLDNKDAAKILQTELDKIDKQKKEYLHDIVYVLRNGVEPDELRYSLRSVCKNFPYRKIWFVGGCPEGIVPDEYVEIIQEGSTPWDKLWNSIQELCENHDITEDFWLFNDDFFVMRPVETEPPTSDGAIYSCIRRIEQGNNGKSPYTKRLRQCAGVLSGNNMDRMNYDVHVPMLMNKYKVLHLLEKFPGIRAAFRSLYGNYYAIGGTVHPDNKIVDLDEFATDDMPFLSTTEESFANGHVGEFIRKRFPNPCKYEKEE